MFEQAKTALGSAHPPEPFAFMIVGLGNPGSKYDGTRHNTGFMAADAIARQCGARLDRLKFKSLCGECVLAGQRVLVLKPSTFMNASGESVRDAMQFYKLPPQNCLIVFDDISLEVGNMRVRRKGSDGGHNGMKSILSLTGSDLFPRIKIGIGAKPHPEYDLAAWVLSHYTANELKALAPALEHAVQAAELIVQDRTEDAMNRFNA